jgi:hypothetical protein
MWAGGRFTRHSMRNDSVLSRRICKKAERERNMGMGGQKESQGAPLFNFGSGATGVRSSCSTSGSAGTAGAATLGSATIWGKNHGNCFATIVSHLTVHLVMSYHCAVDRHRDMIVPLVVWFAND